MLENHFTQSLKEKEELIDIIHHHWASFAWPAAKVVVAFFWPFALITWILASFWFSIALLVYLALVLCYALYKWTVWYFDVFIITDLRIIDIEQKGIFKKTVSEAPLGRIQDVSFRVEGFFQTLFNYGSVTVRTASDGELSLTHVGDPEEVQSVIVELQKLNTQDTKMSAEELVEYIAKLHNKEEALPEDEAEKSKKKTRQL